MPKRRTTERLQPGKSKGNLMSSMQGEAGVKENRAATVSAHFEWRDLMLIQLML